MIPIFFTALSLFCETIGLDFVPKEVKQETVSWIKGRLKEDRQLVKVRSSEKGNLPPNTKKCLTIVDPVPSDTEAPVYVMISFSVPEETWTGLSKEMEKIGAVFVLRGLPSNSFKELSRKIQRLNTLGVKAPIQIDPNLFTKYQIEKVPAFLIVDQEKHSKIAGNISLSYALQKMGGKS